MTPTLPPRVERAREIIQRVAPVLVVALVAVALLVLRHELRGLRYRDVIHAATAIPAGHLLVAFLLTVASYFALPGYDFLGLTYVGKHLPWRRVALGSVIAYGLGNTLGFPAFTSASVRYRFWSSWGLTPGEIAQAAGFVGATFIIGLVFVCGMALLLEPSHIVDVMPIPSALVRPLGIVLVSLVLAYVAWATLRRAPVRVRAWAFPTPRGRIAIAQLAVAAVDWTIAGGVVYALFAPIQSVGFWPFLGVFMLAQATGLISHVPGGAGVFETVMVVLLNETVPADVVLGTLLVYRGVYYLLPFFAATALLVASEVYRQRARVSEFATGAAAVASRWLPATIPYALGAVTLVSGILLLASGATPSEHGRMAILDRMLPLGVIELSHFLASVVGAGLVLLAWAIQRRLDAAYGLTIGLLAIGIVGSLLKGLDWEEATALAVVLMLFIPSRRAFYRKAALTTEPFGLEWTLTVIAVVGAATWLGLFAYRHVEYSDELWWRFTRNGDAPRFLRSTVGVFAALFVFGAMRLLRHARTPSRPSGTADVDRAARIVAQAASSNANLALIGDKTLLFSDKGDAFVMYGIERRTWIAMGDPVGKRDESAELVWRFREAAHQHGARAVFYQIATDYLPLYVDAGYALLRIGEEARVPLATFSLEGGERKGLRRTRRHLLAEGAVVEIIPAERVPPLLGELKAISDAWLAEKRTREKGFSLGRFDPEYLRRFPMALVRVQGRIVAFANIWTAGRAELSIDLMRHLPDSPDGTMEFLLMELMLWGRQEAFAWFNLGMAPLAGLVNRQLAPLWHRAGAVLYGHGAAFYNFQGLRIFKSKFDPVWEPRYLAYTGGSFALPGILTNVASLIGGGVRGVLSR